jgi:large subunit ribosomal protein L30
MAQKLEVTLVKSPIGQTERTRRTIESLGLKRINETVVQHVNGALLGKLEKVKHLVRIREV